MENKLITRDDLIKSGACAEGVDEVITRLWPVPAAMRVSDILRKLTKDEDEYVIRAANLNGNGNGNDDGDGDGSGNGYGYGSGDGSGDGSGYGNGDGCGYGNGYSDDL